MKFQINNNSPLDEPHAEMTSRGFDIFISPFYSYNKKRKSMVYHTYIHTIKVKRKEEGKEKEKEKGAYVNTISYGMPYFMV